MAVPDSQGHLVHTVLVVMALSMSSLLASPGTQVSLGGQDSLISMTSSMGSKPSPLAPTTTGPLLKRIATRVWLRRSSFIFVVEQIGWLVTRSAHSLLAVSLIPLLPIW